MVELSAVITSLLEKLPYHGSPLNLLGDQKGDLVYPALVALAVITVTSSAVKLRKGLKTVNYLPGYRLPFSPFSILGLTLPETSWNPGYYFLWNARHYLYKQFNSDIFSFTPWLAGPPLIFSNNLDVLRQVAYGSHKTDFEKPEEMSQALLFWGQNVVGADGDTWRRHRRIVGPAFNTKLYQYVWNKTAEVYEEMLEAEGWNDKDIVDVEPVQKITFQLALLIISICGFGFLSTWAEPPASPDGTMSVRGALNVINKHSLAISTLPSWVLRLPIPYFKEINEAVTQMKNFMREQVARRKEIVNSGSENTHIDAFTLMVMANEEEETKYPLNESEVIGNVFVLLFAGHETTAHTLAATMAFLACNPDIQQTTLEHILSVVGWDKKPTFEDYNKLDKVLSTFHEALRLFPSGHLMFRSATKDTVIQVPRTGGQTGTESVPVPKGGTVVIDMVGLQYNPRYFDEPEKYKPSRWDNSTISSDEAFTAFSVGPRECVGRKFATTEAVCFLTLLIRDWKIEPLLSPGESLEGWKKRVLDAQQFITLGIKEAPLRFVRRRKRE